MFAFLCRDSWNRSLIYSMCFSSLNSHYWLALCLVYVEAILIPLFLTKKIFFRFIEKLQRNQEFPYILHPISPIINIRYWYGTFVTINESILIHYINLTPVLYSDFLSFHATSFSVSGPIQDITLHSVMSP